MSEVKRFDVPSMRSLAQGEQAVMGYEVVLASDYDALAAKLAMAEDAAAKGDAARQQCGGMEMEIEELRAEAQALREEVAQQKFLTKVENDALKMMTDKANELKSEVEQLEEELESLRARVLVLPDSSTVYAALDARERLFTSPENIRVALEAQSRLNGKTVSERLLLRVLYAISELGDRHLTAIEMQSARELRALLNQDKENGNG
ncbi:hypothetical protein OFL75_31820 [Pseudomonas aeruginosa]|uniref:hypothetical protein n=1 Tax=Pseudomonas aeruginosa TaxID=287 RepID=UPI001930F040|nr:hypothetical protein [Pseudomonas aeruginosa]EKW2387222.1 hypothetical protein [Pseudomonas aeruginosa]MBW6276234.1 hypothetical protein [Pseudomonas aeruginosa]MCD2789649.1 hypothetical protein [Pseudomonas aeruginosa]MCD2845959.1 hypothetical protein [Pseudomonas aeruginosa]MCD2870141.1 hypothetical protein [Pseudomonas aeruginosa]